MAIQRVPVNASIVGPGIEVETPYILSFSVSKNRGAPSTASMSIKVKTTASAATSQPITIEAGTLDKMDRIFTGFIKKINISPCWDDPSYIIMNIDASDIMSNLEGKKFTRRQQTSKTTWVTVNSISKKVPRTKYVKFTNEGTEAYSEEELKNSNVSTSKTPDPGSTPSVEVPPRLGEVLLTVAPVIEQGS